MVPLYTMGSGVILWLALLLDNIDNPIYVALTYSSKVNFEVAMVNSMVNYQVA